MSPARRPTPAQKESTMDQPPYEAPTLTALGTLAELTLGALGGSDDADMGATGGNGDFGSI